MTTLRFLVPGLLVAAFALPSHAADLVLPAPSPAASVTQRVGVTDITVTYSSPGVKGRKVFGKVVELGELWRTGANSATTIEFAHDVTVGGNAVPAGKYAIFSIPPKGAGAWTVILNSVWEQGGTRSYDKTKDAARFTVKPAKNAKRERLAFIFSNTTDTATRLDLEWARVRISIPIAVDTKAIVAAGLKAHQAGTSRSLMSAARYMAAEGNTDGAMVYYDAALAVHDNWMGTWLKAELLAKKGDYKAAYPLAERAHEMGMKADYFFWKDDVEKALADWKKKL